MRDTSMHRRCPLPSSGLKKQQPLPCRVSVGCARLLFCLIKPLADSKKKMEVGLRLLVAGLTVGHGPVVPVGEAQAREQIGRPAGGLVGWIQMSSTDLCGRESDPREGLKRGDRYQRGKIIIK